MFKKLTAILCTLCILLGVGTTALATTELSPMYANSGDVQPRYTLARYVDASLSISGSTAYVYVEAEGISSVTKIKITANLQKKSGSSWTTVKSWTQTTYDNYAVLDESYSPVSSSATYRVSYRAVFNGSETVSGYSNEA